MNFRSVLFYSCLMLCAACGSGQSSSKQSLHYPAADSPASMLYVKKCGHCHAAPLPTAHVSSVWPGILQRMQIHRVQQGFVALTKDELATINGYLQANAKR